MGIIRFLLVMFLLTAPAFAAVDNRRWYDPATDTVQETAPDDSVVIGWDPAANDGNGGTVHMFVQKIREGTTPAQVGADPAGTDNSGLSDDQKAAISAANSPSASNPVATQNDIPQSGVDFDPAGTDNSTDELTSDEQAAMSAANSPSAANPVATQNDIPQSGVDFDPAGTDNSTDELTSDQQAAMSAANSPSAANPVATQNDIPQSGVDFDPAGTDNSTDELTSDQQAAISAANSPSAVNPVATQNDIPATAAEIQYDDTTSQLGASDTQSAVEENDSRLDAIEAAGYLTSESDPGVTTHESTYSHADIATALQPADVDAAAYLGATNGTIGDVVVWVDDGSSNASLPIDVAGSAIEDTGGYYTTDTIEGAFAEIGAGGIGGGGGTWGSITGTITDQTDLTAYVASEVSSALTALGIDVTPAAFTFTDVTDATVSTLYTTSDGNTVSGINFDTAISITGGEYQINSDGWTSSPGTIGSGDAFEVRQTSSADPETQTDTVLTIGGVSDTFSCTTEAGSTACTTWTTDQSQLLTDSENGTGDWVYGQSFQVSQNGTLGAITVYLNGSVSATGNVDCRVGTSADLLSTYTDYGTVNYTLTQTGGEAIEIVMTNHMAVSTGTTYYFGCSADTNILFQRYVANGSQYANGDYYANTTGTDDYNMTVNTGRDLKFEVALCD